MVVGEGEVAESEKEPEVKNAAEGKVEVCRKAAGAVVGEGEDDVVPDSAEAVAVVVGNVGLVEKPAV